MMIEYTSGNILDTDAEALVNPVNCVGVMGAGLALQFKHRFPGNFKLYKKACDEGKVALGRMFVTKGAKTIINFPTKQHWKDSSRYESIQSGMSALNREISERGISSIAIPALGCGLGGLEWGRVKDIMLAWLVWTRVTRIVIYERR